MPDKNTQGTKAIEGVRDNLVQLKEDLSSLSSELVDDIDPQVFTNLERNYSESYADDVKDTLEKYALLFDELSSEFNQAYLLFTVDMDNAGDNNN